MKLWTPLFLMAATLAACSPVSRTALKRKFQETENRFQDHSGFILYDPTSDKVLFEHNASRYFTPASNTKIFTLYAGLSILGDSIPALRYSMSGDSLIFSGTGDPSFLYGHVYDNCRTYNFLKRAPQALFYSESNWETTHFGPGWSWEDYDFPFSAVRSPFPIYGNTFEAVQINASLSVRPEYFSDYIVHSHDTTDVSSLIRSPFSNYTVFHPGRTDKIRKWTKPFISDSSVVVALLSDTLGREVRTLHDKKARQWKTLYSMPADSLYRVMMQDSDNFIAEQLLLSCSAVLSDTLSPEIAIEFMKAHYLADLPDEPIWKDGSGLSRYNLFTPRSIVVLWNMILEAVPRQRLFSLLATGGVSGTLKNSYRGDSPYIYGKTGTLSNVHCLSGYIVTKKQRTLIFSFMNTNFTAPTREVRARMESIMKLIHDHY